MVVARHRHVLEGQAGLVGIPAVVERDRAADLAIADGNGAGEVAGEAEGDVVEHRISDLAGRAHVEQHGVADILHRQIADGGVVERRRRGHGAVDHDAGLRLAAQADAALERDVLVIAAVGDQSVSPAEAASIAAWMRGVAAVADEQDAVAGAVGDLLDAGEEVGAVGARATCQPAWLPAVEGSASGTVVTLPPSACGVERRVGTGAAVDRVVAGATVDGVVAGPASGCRCRRAR